MKKAFVSMLLAALFLASLTGCAQKKELAETAVPVAEEPIEAVTSEPAGEAAVEQPLQESKIDLPDGVYLAEFKTDSTMFHVNDADEGKGILTVEGGKATIHIRLVGKSILNLYPGLAEDAKKDGAVLLEPTTETVTYKDGYTEEVFAFDIPVPAIGEEFDVALIGKKGKWYDHKVSVQNPLPSEE